MRISDWSSDVCSSDLLAQCLADLRHRAIAGPRLWAVAGLAAGFRLARRRSGGADPARRRTRAADDGGGDEARSEERRVGKRVSVRVDLGGRRTIKKNNTIAITTRPEHSTRNLE